jgi:glycosyltransferase involved in cell wall biosynthesis
MSVICMFVPSSSGGHARYARELLSALAAQAGASHRFELVSSEDLHAEFQHRTYPVHAILPALRHRNEFPNSAAWAFSRATHYLRRELDFLAWLRTRPDIEAVHLQEWTPWLAAPMIRRIKAMNKQVFYTIHNIVPHKYPRFLPKSVMHSWIRKACLLCDGLFVHTDDLARRASEFLCDPHPPIHVIPVSMKDRLARKKLLFFGSIRSNKGLHSLLDAMPELHGYSLTIAGEASEADYFQSQIQPRIQKLRAAGVEIDLRAEFTPEEKVGALLQDHSAIILPYTSGFVAQSGVVFLALAYGMPVVASGAGGLGELLSHHKFGLTFSDSSPEQISRAIRKLFTEIDPGSLRREIALARRQFSWEEAAQITSAAYGKTEERSAEPYDCSLAPHAVH